MFVFEVIGMMVFFFCFLNLSRGNILIWWRVFVLMTIVFCILRKEIENYVSIINYFVIQERLGLFFLILNYSLLQFIVVMMKVGVAPLHFWLFRVTSGLFNWVLIWFLTFQKVPFFPVLLQLFNFKLMWLFLLGILICYLQLFVIKGHKNIMVISSTESFNWVLIVSFLSLVNVFFLFFYYVVLIVVVMPLFTKKEVSFINWETIFVFMNVPFSVSFFIKIYSLGRMIFFVDWFFLLVLFLMFLSLLSFSIWLINIRVKNFLFLQDNYKSLFFLCVPIMFFSLI